MIISNRKLFSLLFMLLMSLPMTSLANNMLLEKSFLSNWTLSLELPAAPLKTMTEVPFSIQIHDEHGQQVSDAILKADLDMPAMPMPPNHPHVAWEKNAYRGTAVFTMAGKWTMTIQIDLPDGTQDQVLFELDNVKMK